MKKQLRFILLLMLSALPFSLMAQSVTLASWDFTGENQLATSTAEVSNGLNAVPVLTRGATAGASAGNNSFRTTGFMSNGIALTNTDYYQFDVTPATGNKISLTNIQVRFAGTATFYTNNGNAGVANRFAYSKNGVDFVFFPAVLTVTTGSTAAYTYDLTTSLANDLKDIPEGTTITIRYYASGQSNTGGWGFNSPSSGSLGLVLNGSITTVGGVDTTPPTTTANYPKATNITATSTDLTTNISESGKTYYIVVSTPGTTPTPAQLKAGNDASGAAAFKSGSTINIASTDATATISGLAAATGYTIYTISEDATPNLQTTVSSLNITTLPLVDVIPPTNAVGYPKTNSITMTSFDVISNLNENGKTFYVLVPSGGAAPTTSAQIKAGLDGTNAAAFKAGSFDVLASADATATITGLSPTSAYQLFVVSQDAAPNLQSTFSILNVTTLSPPLPSPIIISQYYEGTSTNKWIELTNLSDQPINTAAPQLKLALYNISGDAGTINITGTPSQVVSLNITIPAHGTVLIGNSGNGAEVPYITPASAAQISNTVINFNGNDGVALLDNANNIIDAFGQGVNAKDISYVRNLNVTAGNAIFNVNDWEVVSIQSVQNAIDDDDQVRLGVHFAPNLSPCSAPTVAATGLIFSNTTTNSITGTFTGSTDANEYLVVRSLNSTLSAVPVDGTVYNVGTAFGGGVISARLVTNTFTDNNLISSTPYYYFIFPLNNTSCTGGPVYLTNNILSATVTTKTLSVCSTPLNQPVDFTITSSNYNFIQGTYTLPTTPSDEYLVIMTKNAAFNGAPVNQTVYTVGDAIGDGVVIKRGTGNTFVRTGLAQNTTYYFYVYAVNSSCSGGPLYLTTNPLKGSQKTGILDANNLNFYYGNLHSHSSYSDGNKDNLQNKPEQDYAFAKNSMKMDFLGISEHNHTQAGMSLANWQPGINAAKAATTSTFVALHGMEWGVISGGGHVIVYGIDSLIGWEPGENQIFVPKSTYTGSTGLFRIINRHGLNAVATLAHPNTTDFGNIAANYDISADSAIVGSALESGPAFSTNTTYSDPASSMSYLSYYNRMLARGYHLGATIDHDNHNLTFGRHTRARLVVLAPALTENDLLDAMKKMRFYASEDSAARVTFTINKLPVGSVFTGAGAPEISFSMATTNPVTSIKLMFGIPGSGVTPTEIANSANGTLNYTHAALANLSTGYYYGDIVESDGSRIITSPIWYTRDASYVKAVQHITFPASRAMTFGDPDADGGASSDNPSTRITYTTSDPAIATVVDDKIHILHAGTVTITASQESDALFQAATAQQILTIAAKPITVAAVANKKLTDDVDPAFTYTTTGTLVGVDAFSGALSRTPGETAGTYSITQGTLALSADYAISYAPAPFIIQPRPVAAISTDVTVAQNATPPPIIFTATSGTAPFTFTYHINTGADLTLTTTTNTATVSAPTTTIGTYVYRVTQIADANSSAVQQLSSTVIVKSLPLASISGTAPVCVNGGASVVTFTGSNGTGPYTFSYTVNGGAIQNITTTTGNTVTLSVPSNIAGKFSYDLINVADVYGSQSQSGRATIQVNALATAAISGDATVVVGAQQSAVTFTAANGQSPYVFTYTLNGGPSQTVTASTGNTAIINVPTTIAGSYTYNLIQIADINCSQPQTGSVTVQVRPLPLATISGSTAVCAGGTSPVITFTGANGTAPYTFTYTLNGVRNTVTSNSASSTIAVSAVSAGVYNYVLESVSDVYGSQAQSGTAVVTVNVLPAIQINSSRGLTISKGESIVLTALGGIGNATYSWTGNEILSGQNTPSALIRPKISGIYSVRVTNATGCSTTEQVTVTVTEDYKLEASTIVTPNGDGKNDKFIIKNIDYYPNNTLKIFDKAGRVIYTVKSYANDWDGTLNGSPLAEGTYYYILDLGPNRGNFKGFINILKD